MGRAMIMTLVLLIVSFGRSRVLYDSDSESYVSLPGNLSSCPPRGWGLEERVRHTDEHGSTCAYMNSAHGPQIPYEER
jgi:hypothetical protein